jgi:hypothetical protein
MATILYRFIPDQKAPPGPLTNWICKNQAPSGNPPSVLDLLAIFDLSCEDFTAMYDNGLRHVLIREMIYMFEREVVPGVYSFLIESCPAPREADLSKHVKSDGETVLVYLPVVVPSSRFLVHLAPDKEGKDAEFDFYAGIDENDDLYMALSVLGDGKNIMAYRANQKGVKRKPNGQRFRGRLHDTSFPVLFYVRRTTKFMDPTQKIAFGLGEPWTRGPIQT